MNRRQFLSSLLAAIGAVALRPLMPLMPVPVPFDSAAFDAFLADPSHSKPTWVLMNGYKMSRHSVRLLLSGALTGNLPEMDE